MRRNKCILLGAICLLILALVFVVAYRGVIFQRGNPLPYIGKMFTLNNSSQYVRVFDDEDVYMTQIGNDDELIKYIEVTYKVTFTEQMGSAYIFDSNEYRIIVTSEIYWRYYQVWELEFS